MMVVVIQACARILILQVTLQAFPGEKEGKRGFRGVKVNREKL